MSVTPLSRNRDFTMFWAAQTLSGVGDAFAAVAAPLLVLRATGSLEHLGVLGAVAAGAYVVAGVFAGSIVDRVDRRRILIACDVARAAIYMFVPLWWWLLGPSLPLLFVASAIGATLGSVYQLASLSAVATLVPREQLIAANARMHASYALACCLGPVVAGYTSHALGPVVGIAIDALSFAVSGACIAFVRGSLAPADAAPRAQSVIADLAVGLRFIVGHPTLRATLVLISLGAFLLAARDQLLVYRLTRDLGHGDTSVGMMFAVASASTIAAAAVVSRLRARFGFATCWLTAGIVMGCALVLGGASLGAGAVIAVALVLASGETIRAINSSTLRQELTPRHLLGRVTAVWWAITALPATLGAVVNARLAAALGVGTTQAVLGALLVLVMLAGAATAIRQPTPEPEGLS